MSAVVSRVAGELGARTTVQLVHVFFVPSLCSERFCFFIDGHVLCSV